MAQARGVKATKVKVQEHRDRLRAQGLRPIQISGAGRARLLLSSGSASAVRSRSRKAPIAGDDQAFIDAGVPTGTMNEGGGEVWTGLRREGLCGQAASRRHRAG